MIKIITLPFNAENEGFDDEVINHFLAGKIIQQIKAELFQQNGLNYWTVWLEYEPVLNASEKKQTSVVLSAQQQELLTALKQWRREWADQQAVPVFIIATNKELETIAVQMPKSLEGLRSIQGFGRKKTEKYGKLILQIVARYTDNKQLIPADSK